MRIPDAVVPVAGLGTRLLPATKSQPKEMLPVAGRPVVQHVVEELAGAGAQRVLFVTGRGKDSIEDHFDVDEQLIRLLRETGREELLAALDYERMGVEYLYTRQRGQRGLGDAVLCARPFVGDRPFVLALGDSIVGGPDPGAVVRALGAAFQDHGAACAIAVQPVPPSDVERYGIVVPAGPAPGPGETFAVAGLVEKPAPATAPGNLAVAARYVLGPQAFAALERIGADRAGEVQLTDALALMVCEGATVVGVRLPADHRRHDAGTPEGYAETFLEFALADPRHGPSLRRRLGELLDAPEPR